MSFPPLRGSASEPEKRNKHSNSVHANRKNMGAKTEKFKKKITVRVTFNVVE